MTIEEATEHDSKFCSNCGANERRTGMVEIVMSGMCEGCKYAELVLDVYRAESNENFWSVSCTHGNACYRIGINRKQITGR